MGQTSTLLRTLKRVLKVQGLTYRKVAVALGLSEASVKRMFSEENLSLERFDQICQLMGLEFADLIREMESEAHRISSLTEAQELDLVSDGKLLLVAFLVVSGWKADDILERLELSLADVIRCLTRLDKLGMIELLPGNRIKLLVSPNFAWRRNGPIQRFFTANFLEDFLESSFERRNEHFAFLSGMLSRASITTLHLKMEKLISEFNELHVEDQQLPLSQRQGYSAILAMRPWRPSAMDAFLK